MPKTTLDKEISSRLEKLFSDNDSRYDRNISNYIKLLIKEYRIALREIQFLLADMYDTYGEEVSYGDMQSYNRLKNLETNIYEELQRLGVRSKNIIKNSIKDFYSQNYYFTGYALETSIGVKLGFGLLNRNAIEASVYNELLPSKWTKKISGSLSRVNEQIKTEITQGLIHGKGYVKTARAIKEKLIGKDFDKFKRAGGSLYDIIRTVQTETHRVQTMGKLAGIDKSNRSAENLGIEVQTVWVATLDQKTRDSHRILDGQAADKKGLFHIRGLSAKGPGLFGVGNEDINCRCTLRVQIIGYEPKVRKDNESKDLIPNMTFKQWAELKGISFTRKAA